MTDWKEIMTKYQTETTKKNRAIGDLIEYYDKYANDALTEGVIVDKDFMPRSWIVADAKGNARPVGEDSITRQIGMVT